MAAVTPLSLQEFCSRALVAALLNTTVKKVTQICKEEERCYLVEREEAHSDMSRTPCRCFDCVTTALKELFQDQMRWMKSEVPFATREKFLASLDDQTELMTKSTGVDSFYETLTNVMMKLVHLNKVFIDRDYGDKGYRCLLPPYGESVCSKIIDLLQPLPCSTVSIYGALYPDIQESILRSSNALSTLVLSHINITDDMLVTIGECCKNLRTLRLLHVLLWNMLSIESFCSAFFEGMTKEEIERAIRTKNDSKVKLSLPKLKELELFFGPNNDAVNYHLFVLSFYRNTDLVFSDWRSGYFEMGGYDSFFQAVIKKSIRIVSTISITTLILTASDILVTNESYIDFLTFACPLLSKIVLSITRFSMNDSRTISNKFKMLLNKKIGIKSLYIDVAGNIDEAMIILRPSLLIRSNSLTELTLEVKEQRAPGMLMIRLKEIMRICVALKSLRIKVCSRSDLALPDMSERFKFEFPVSENLSEIWIHELFPVEEENSYSNMDFYNRLKLFRSLNKAAYNLETFSCTVQPDMADLLINMSGNCKRLHIAFHEGCDRGHASNHVRKLVTNFKNLEELFLEDICEKCYVELLAVFNKTVLKLLFGTIDGWPRS